MDNPYARCDNCDHEVASKEDMKSRFPCIDNLLERLDPGDIVPAGECPECGALMHEVIDHPAVRPLDWLDIPEVYGGFLILGGVSIQGLDLCIEAIQVCEEEHPPGSGIVETVAVNGSFQETVDLIEKESAEGVSCRCRLLNRRGAKWLLWARPVGA